MGLQSLLPHNLHFITEELRQTYSDVLLKIAQDLKREEQEELQFLCTHKINSETTTVTDTLNIFIELERIGKISWENVCFLKKILTQLLRSNLAESLLTKYEIMRDVTLLLGLYANKRHGWNANQRISSSVEKLSDYLFNVTKETSRTCTEGDKLDLTFNVSVLGEEDIKEMLVEFEQEIESKFTSDSLSKLTMLVVVAGELVFEAFVNGEKRDATNICFIAFDKIYHRMQELRIGWKEFCSHVEKRYRSVDQQPSYSEQEKIALVVQKLKETTFFQYDDAVPILSQVVAEESNDNKE